jgi:hypothetical protein
VSTEGSSTQRATDGLLGVGASTIGVLLIVGTRHLAYFDRTGPGPALAPGIVGVALVACGIALFASARGVAAPTLRLDPADVRIAAMLGLLLAAALAIDLIGLAPTAMLLVLGSARIVAGARLVHAVALAVLVGAVLVGGSVLLGMPLSLGAIGDVAGRVR